ncbi:chymotrypsin-2-like [Trichogramma pretiosum]|uniref:chymotrypsin-2-like n=1 Tax=Trichogramma pretiosum TaxID=7493 RepID=UPI0006C9953B|nr:chymotrypsin-2-like [Trichogramma pretiosum]
MAMVVNKVEEIRSRVKRQIYGGWKAEDATHLPHLVYLRRNGWTKPSWLPSLIHHVPFIGDWFATPFHCGGVIIHKRFVLTASHCIIGDAESEVKRLEVVAGTSQLKHPHAGDVKAYAVEAIVVHNVPGHVYIVGDIALIRIKKHFEYGPEVARAKLPPPNYKVAPNTWVTIGGWGVTEASNDPLDLHYFHTRVAHMEVCQAAWKAFIKAKYPLNSAGINFDKMIDKHTMMCVQGREGQGVCSGDSGSGAVTSDGYVLGIVSFGATPCGNSHIIPDVMSYVPHYVPWIKEQMVAMIKQSTPNAVLPSASNQ